MSRIIGINDIQYRGYRKVFGGSGKHNGAYYYAKEIEENIVPLVKTDRNWDLLGMKFTQHYSHSIVFIHHCLDWDMVYPWLEKLKDPILVVSTYPTLEWAQSKGYKAIFLPLSIDVGYVKKFSTKKTKNACYAGNRWAFKKEQEDKHLPNDLDFPPADLERDDLLRFMAPYKKCYAIGRCAIEAMVLGCKIMPFLMDRYPDPKYWKILDNRDAAAILQKELDKIDEIR
jgi:hypothetical protein